MPLQNLTVEDTSVIVGSDVNVFLNGDQVAFMDEVDIDRNYNQTAIRALGNWFAKDYKSLFFEGSFTAKLWLLSEAEEGGASLPVLEEVLTAGPLLFEFRQKSTGKRIMRALCKLNTERSNMSSNAASARTVSFVLVRITHNEAYN